jgi:hypothetical protein
MHYARWRARENPSRCSVGNCNHPLFSNGFCKKHYDRWKRHGDPGICLKPLVKRGLPMQWLKEHLAYADDTCLIWPFARHPDHGYPHGSKGRPTRIMCEMAHGPAPSSLHEAAHSCGNGDKGCINPKHLRWATPKENAADKLLHGTVTRGEQHGCAKLTSAQVREIRLLHGTVLQKDIAEQFGVTNQHISSILNYKVWRYA